MSGSETFFTHLPSPIGPLLLAGSDEGLRLVSFADGRGARQPKAGWKRDDTAFAETTRQLCAYFDGRLTDFDLPLEPVGNPFQMAIWARMRKIPCGETMSYGDMARAIGEPVSGSRAVGAACGDNPLPVVIPCHRVVGAGQSLVGFGGGIERKKFLLDLEFRMCPPKDTLFALM